jgi:uncharacterized membrane protein YoaK (UPF0700 family)
VKPRAKAVVALALTFAAGCVDIIGFLSLYQTFTAHMTGVTVHLGQDLTVDKGRDAVVLALTLIAFVLGSVAGRTIIEAGLRKKLRSAAAAALILEFVLLVAVGAGGANVQWHVPMILLLAAAMGVQTATLTRVGPLTVHTTFVTGMLNKLAQLLSNTLFLGYDEAHGRHEHSHLRPQVHRQALFLFLIWVLYVGGAVVGTATQSLWGVRSLFVPAGAVLAVTIFDQVNPMAIQEEKDQGER